MSFTEKNGLKINSKLFNFINNEVIPGTNIKSDEFWSNFEKAVHIFEVKYQMEDNVMHTLKMLQKLQ